MSHSPIKFSPIYAHGLNQPAPPSMRLSAGRLSMLFEPASTYLRSIHWELADGRRLEVLRGIYAAVRDHNWDTFAPRVTDLHHEITTDGFSLRFQASCTGPSGSFDWTGHITGQSCGMVRFEMAGQVTSTFRRNRIGFCVLHPSELAGQPCTIQLAEDRNGCGPHQECAFPQTISPHQPMKNLRSITHQVLPGIRAKVLMEGDAFEMEDQRNWTDASFKTYCTPLELPFPVQVASGEKVSQVVTLTLEGPEKKALPVISHQRQALRKRLVMDPLPKDRLPEIGLGFSSECQELGGQERTRLASLQLAHLRVDLDLTNGQWRQTYDLAATLARDINVQLEVALFLSAHRQNELSQLKSHLARHSAPVRAWLIFHHRNKPVPASWIEMVQGMLEPLGRSESNGSPPLIVSGTNAYFTELNRERPAVERLDAVCYSINPQVHAFDNASLVETLPMQGVTVESTRQFCGDLPIRITPVTFRPRFNPNATGPESEPHEGELPAQVDPRQLSLFGAAWTLGSLKHLARSRVQSVTYYETTGWRGVLESAQSPTRKASLQEKFPSSPGCVFPIYHLLADIGEFSGGDRIATQSSSPLEFEGLAIQHNRRRRLLMTSYIEQPQIVHIERPHPHDMAPSRDTAWLKSLDQDNVSDAMSAPEQFRTMKPTPITADEMGVLKVTISPYSTIRIDWNDEN